MGGDARDGDYSNGGSPRGAVSLDALDYALRYYDVLDRRQSLLRPEPLDEYEQVSFSGRRHSELDLQKRGRNGNLVNLTRNVSSKLRAAHADIRGRATQPFQLLRGSLNQASTRFRQPIVWTPGRVLLRDKLVFLLGVSHVAVVAFWLGHSPSTFYRLYTVKAFLLFGLRLVTYKRDKMHYYLFDFCYFANLMLVVQVWALPESCALGKILFAFSMGPLAWSIIAFRNSMIFHSLDKMTSVFLHAVPALVTWTQRWYPGDPHHWKRIKSASCESKEANVWELIVIPWIPYALWAVVYYLKVFVISSRRIQERGYHTLFQYVTRKPKSLFGRAFRRLPRWASPLVFMFWHVAFCAVTFVLSWVMWQSYWLNTAFLVVMLGWSTYNGGNYYFDVFAKRYFSEAGVPTGAIRTPAPAGRSLDSSDIAAPENGALGQPVPPMLGLTAPHLSAGDLQGLASSPASNNIISPSLCRE